MAFRVVHTADVHLDSPLATLALRDPALADLSGGATRQAFVAVIDLCIVEQGRDINEAGSKSATLATIGDDRKIATEGRLTSVAEFVPVDLEGASDWREALKRIETGLEAAREAAPSEHLFARFQLTGATSLAW